MQSSWRQEALAEKIEQMINQTALQLQAAGEADQSMRCVASGGCEPVMVGRASLLPVFVL